jgi:hypothetical protein
MQALACEVRVARPLNDSDIIVNVKKTAGAV